MQSIKTDYDALDVLDTRLMPTGKNCMTMDNNEQDTGVISETLVVPCQGGYEEFGPLKRIYG